MKRAFVIVNPVAGRGKGAALIPQIESFLGGHGWACEFTCTDAAGHAQQLASDVKREDFDVILAVGGDGTINEVIAGSRREAWPVAIMPLGTGNVLAKEMRLTGAPLEALKALVEGYSHEIDLCQLNDGRYFVTMLSAGIDGAIVRALSEARAGGVIHMLNYVPLGLKAFMESKYRINAFRAGQLWQGNASYVICANTRSYGGPLEFVSGADAADGKLNLLASTLNLRVGYLAMIGSALVRSVSRLNGIRECETEDFRLESANEREVPYQIDGEYAGVLPVAGRILKGALTIFADQSKER